MKKTLGILVLILLIAFGGYYFYQNQQKKVEKTENKTEEKVIKIGAILPLTGKLAIMGEYEKKAMELAAEEIRKKSKKIKIIFADSHSNAKDGVNAANKLLNTDDVDIIISSTTGISLAVKPKVLNKQKNLIAFCMDPDIANSSDYVVRYYIGIQQETEALIDYFKKLKNIDSVKVGILYAKVAALEKTVNNSYIPFFKKEKIAHPFIESYNLKEKDFNNLILKMKNKGINHLIILGYGFEYPSIYKPLIEQGMLNKLQIMGGWGFLYTPVDKKYLEGTLVAGPLYLFQSKDKAKFFLNSFKNKYKIDANFDAAFAYETIFKLSKFLNKKNVKNPLTPLLVKKDTIQGIIGNYYFDKFGNMIVKTGLGRITNGLLLSN